MSTETTEKPTFKPFEITFSEGGWKEIVASKLGFIFNDDLLLFRVLLVILAVLLVLVGTLLIFLGYVGNLDSLELYPWLKVTWTKKAAVTGGAALA